MHKSRAYLRFIERRKRRMESIQNWKKLRDASYSEKMRCMCEQNLRRNRMEIVNANDFFKKHGV
jgi:hypothetical protein